MRGIIFSMLLALSISAGAEQTEQKFLGANKYEVESAAGAGDAEAQLLLLISLLDGEEAGDSFQAAKWALVLAGNEKAGESERVLARQIFNLVRASLTTEEAIEARYQALRN